MSYGVSVQGVCVLRGSVRGVGVYPVTVHVGTCIATLFLISSTISKYVFKQVFRIRLLPDK